MYTTYFKMPETKEEISEFKNTLAQNRKKLGAHKAKKYGKIILGFMRDEQAKQIIKNIDAQPEVKPITFAPDTTKAEQFDKYLELARETFSKETLDNVYKKDYGNVFFDILNLVIVGADVNCTISVDGIMVCPLRLALGYPILTKLFCLAGANPNFFDKHSEEYLVMEAANACLDEDLQILLDFGADPNAHNCYNECAIHRVTDQFKYEKHGKCLEILLSSGANPNAVNRNNDTAATGIAESMEDRVEGIELLHKYGANFNIQNTALISPLHIVASNNKLAQTEALINLVVDPTLKNYKGFTAIELTTDKKVSDALSSYEELWPFVKPRNTVITNDNEDEEEEEVR